MYVLSTANDHYSGDRYSGNDHYRGQIIRKNDHFRGNWARFIYWFWGHDRFRGQKESDRFFRYSGRWLHLDFYLVAHMDLIYNDYRAFFWTFWKKLKPEKTQNSSEFSWKLKQNFRKTQKPPTQLELLQFKSCIFIPKMCRRLNFSVNHIHYKLYDIQKLLIFRIH